MSEPSVEDIALSHMTLVDKADVQTKRQEHRDNWFVMVNRVWDNLGHDQKEHCINPHNVDRWWPETSNRETYGD